MHRQGATQSYTPGALHSKTWKEKARRNLHLTRESIFDVPVCLSASAQTHLRGTTCAHLEWHVAPKALTETSQLLLLFLPSLPLPTAFTAPPQVPSPPFEAIPGFCPVQQCPTSCLAVGMEQIPGTRSCSGAVTKPRLHNRQQLLIYFQRWNLWLRLLKLWFKSVANSTSGRERNLIHLRQLQELLLGKEKETMNPNSISRSLLLPDPCRDQLCGKHQVPTCLKSTLFWGPLKHQSILARIQILFTTKENKKEFARLPVWN